MPFVGPALAELLTTKVYTPMEPRLKSPGWDFVIERAALATVSVADAELPLPPLLEVTAPVVLI